MTVDCSSKCVLQNNIDSGI